LSVLIGLGHEIEELSPENLRQGFDIEQIGTLAGLEGTIGFQYAAGDQAMQMKMCIETLIPSV